MYSDSSSGYVSLMKELGNMPVLPLHCPSYQSELTAEKEREEFDWRLI